MHKTSSVVQSLDVNCTSQNIRLHHFYPHLFSLLKLQLSRAPPRACLRMVNSRRAVSTSESPSCTLVTKGILSRECRTRTRCGFWAVKVTKPGTTRSRRVAVSWWNERWKDQQTSWHRFSSSGGAHLLQKHITVTSFITVPHITMVLKCPISSLVKKQLVRSLSKTRFHILCLFVWIRKVVRWPFSLPPKWMLAKCIDSYYQELLTFKMHGYVFEYWLKNDQIELIFAGWQ